MHILWHSQFNFSFISCSTCICIHSIPFHTHLTILHSFSDRAYKHLLDEHTVKRLVFTYTLCVVLYRLFLLMVHIVWTSLRFLFNRQTNGKRIRFLNDGKRKRKTYHSYLYVIWQRIEIYTITEWMNVVSGMGVEGTNTYERLPIHRQKTSQELNTEKITTNGKNTGTPCEHLHTHAAEYSKCFTIAVSKNIKIITKKLWHEIEIWRRVSVQFQMSKWARVSVWWDVWQKKETVNFAYIPGVEKWLLQKSGREGATEIKKTQSKYSHQFYGFPSFASFFRCVWGFLSLFGCYIAAHIIIVVIVVLVSSYFFLFLHTIL